MELLEVSADRHRLADLRAVVELEHRHRRLRIPRAVVRLESRLRAADVLDRDLEALLGEVDENAAWVRGFLPDVELHGAEPIPFGSLTQPAATLIRGMGSSEQEQLP